MLKVGTHVQDFSLLNDEGELFKLSNHYGKKVVIYFYPKADTPGCTTQACQFRDMYDEFLNKDLIVVGISKDSVKVLKKFKDKHHLPFTLLSDQDTQLCEYFGVWVEKSMYGKKYMGIQRATFVLDESGVITHVFEKASPDTNAQDILEVI